MRTVKSAFPVRLKAAPLDDGTFEAIVSVFGNVDHIGDRVMKGAFRGSLDRWAQSGDPIPVVWSHRWDDPDYHIGKVLDARETAEGLWIKAQVDIDRPVANQVHHLLKERRVREFSFAYDVIDEGKADGANELRELEIIEVGPTLKGMNPATQLLAAKAAKRLAVPSPSALRNALDGGLELDRLTPASANVLLGVLELEMAL